MTISFGWFIFFGIIALIVGVILNNIPWGLLGIGLLMVSLIMMIGAINAHIFMLIKQNQNKR